MKGKILFVISIICILLSCKPELKSSIKQYYLNKGNIEIVEFKNNKIFRYQLIDSIKTKLKEKDLIFFSNSKDSFKIASNDSLVYKKINLNTEDSIDFYTSQYWTIKLKDGEQFWDHFIKLNDTLENGSFYHLDAYMSYYYHPKYKDTS